MNVTRFLPSLAVLLLSLVAIALAGSTSADLLEVDDDYSGDSPPYFTTVQAAINYAAAGVDQILVHSGTYAENVLVNKTVSIVGESQAGSIVDPASGHGITVTAPNVNLSYLTVQGANFGIAISGLGAVNASVQYVTLESNVRGIWVNAVNGAQVSNCYFGNHSGSGNSALLVFQSSGFAARNNTFYGNYYAVYIDRSPGAIVRDGNITYGRFGVLLDRTNGTIVDKNDIWGMWASGYGVYLSTDRNSVISSNTIHDFDRYGFWLTNSANETFYLNILTNLTAAISINPTNSLSGHFFGHTFASSNMVQGKPTYYYVNTTNVVVPSGAGWVGAYNVTNFTAPHMTTSRVWSAIYLNSVRNVVIQGVNLTGSTSGFTIYALYAYNVQNLTATGLNLTGAGTVAAIYTSSNVIIRDSRTIGNAPDPVYFARGPQFVSVASVQVINNTIQHAVGISVSSASDVLLLGNSINDTDQAIYLTNCPYPRIFSNTLTNAPGPVLYGSSMSHYQATIPANNTLDGRPFRSFINVTSPVVPTNLAWVLFANATNASVSSFVSAPRAYHPAIIAFSTNVTFVDARTNDTQHGIYVVLSAGVNIWNLVANNSSSVFYSEFSSKLNVANGTWTNMTSQGVALYYTSELTLQNISMTSDGIYSFLELSQDSDLVFRNITASGMYVFMNGYESTGITIEWVNATAFSSSFAWGENAIYAYNLSSVTIANSTFSFFVNGLYLEQRSWHYNLQNVSILDVSQYGFMAISSDNGDITLSNFRAAGYDPSASGGVYLSYVGGTASMSGLNLSNFTYGVYADPMWGVVVTGSQFDDIYYGVYFWDIHDSVISGNTFTDIYAYAVYLGYNTNVTVSSNSFAMSGSAAIVLSNSERINVLSNNIQGPSNGIEIQGGSGDLVSSNIVNATYNYGIYIDSAHTNSTFLSNTVTNGSTGIFIDQPFYLRFFSNAASGNQYNWRLTAYWIEHFYHQVPTNNTAEGKPVYYLVNATGGVVPVTAGWVVLANVSSYTVLGPSITRMWDAVRLFDVRSTNIINVTLSESYYGIAGTYLLGCTIRDSTVNGAYYGMQLEQLVNTSLLRNRINGSLYSPVQMYYAWNMTFDSNVVNNSQSSGAYLYSVDHSNLTNNRFENGNGYGLELSASTNDVFYNNTFLDNFASFSMWGYDLAHFTHTLPVNNTIQGRPIYLYVNQTGVVSPAGAGMVILANVTGGTVNGGYFDRVGTGVLTWRSQYLNISNVTFGRGYTGISLRETRDVWVFNISTNLSNCCIYSILSSEYGTYNVTLKDSRIEYGYTIFSAYYTENIRIANLTVGSESLGYGTSSVFQASGRVNNVTIENNDFNYTSYTVSLYGYGDTDAVTNITVSNSSFGQYTYNPLYVGTEYVFNLTFYHNNFYLNAWYPYGLPVDDYGVSVWDLGYPLGGNYWANWTSPDDYNDAFQSTAGGDGIVDDPFVPAYNWGDAYPLSRPWPPRTTMVSPANGSAIQPGTTLEFDVPLYFDGSNYTISGSSPVAFTAPFNISTTGWSDGTYLIWVNSTDATGISDNSWFVFVVDSVAPSISAVAPTPGGTYAEGTSLDFSITDAHLASNATWDIGWGETPFWTQWNISTWFWPEGSTNVTIRAWDTAGNLAQQTFQYTIDSNAPSIVLDSPSPGSVFVAGTTIALDIADLAFQNASWTNGSGWNALTAPFDISTSGWADGSFTLEVVAFDAFGRQSSANWGFTIDSTPPAISLTTPPNNSVRVAGTTLDFDVVDDNFQNASWSNIGTWTSFTAPFQVSTSGWADGVYVVEVSATDQAGSTSYASFVITIDATLPTITLNSPGNNSVIKAGTILDFTLGDSNPGSASWTNGSFTQLNWSFPFDIDTTGWLDGPVTITITAIDAASNTRVRSFNFTMDTTLPTITLAAPANGSYVRAGRPLDFVVSDTHPVSVLWNNGSSNQALLSPFDVLTNGWPDGPTTVTVTATDTAGNVRVASFVFTFDSTFPSVTLATPSNNSAVQSGTVLDFVVSDLNLNLTTWSNGSGNLSLASPHNISTAGWAQGTFAIYVNATDLANNTQVLQITIHIDNAAPNIVLNQPTNGSTFGAGTLIDFSVTDAHSFTATWNNGSGSVALTSPFDVDTTGWADQTLTLWVNATDVAGNSISRSFSFTIDNSFPAVILVAPANNSVIIPGVDLDFDVVDNDLNNVTVDYGLGPSAFTPPYMLDTLGFSDGGLNVTIVAIDNSSHTVVVVFHFTIDSVQPTITLDSPSNGSVLRAGTSINLTVGDLNLASVTWNNGSGPNVVSSPHDIPTVGWPNGNVTVSIVATDLAGNSRSTSYSFVVDSSPPTVTLVSPANGSVIVPGTTVVFTLSDAHAFGATWDNGSGPTAFAVLYNVTTAGWAEGPVTLTVVGTDLVGNVGTLSVTFEVDASPPTISLVAPTNGSAFAPGTIIDIEIVDLHLTSATFNNGSGAQPLSSPFNINTTGWPEGPTTVVVVATDAAGNQRMSSFEFTVDATGPAITLLTPANNSYIRPGTALNFSVADATALTVTWDNGTGQVVLPSPYSVATGGWPQGPVTVIVRATDAAGNGGAASFSFTVDATPPSIVLSSPANNSAFAAGTTIDLAIADLNGVASALRNNGSGPLPLASPYDIVTTGWTDGAITLIVSATDVAGNFNQTSFAFTIDSTPPTISLTSPANNSVIAPATTLVFSITDLLGLANASWSNGSGGAALLAPFQVSTAGWPEGAVTVVVWAYDLAGNGRSASFSFTLDATPPTVTLDSPSNNSVVLPGTTVALTVSDLHLSTVTWDNGSGTVALSSPHDIPTSGWADGLYNITVVARDLAGNNRTAVFRISLDSQAPSVSLMSPANNSVILGGVVIDVNITDTNLGSATWSNGTGNNALNSPFDISTAGWPDGVVFVFINVTDLAGNSRSVSFRFVMDSTAPNLALVSPGNNSYVIPGTAIDLDASDLNLASVSWNNGSGPVSLSSPYDVPTDGWADGPRNVTVVVSDIAGNSVTRTFNFTFDSVLPVVVLISPSNGSIITAGTLINLTITDLHLNGVTWNNGSGNNALSSPFDISTAGWADGNYSVTVVATDLAGNARVVVYQFLFDTTAPVITLASPANNSHIRPGQILDLQVLDLTALTVTWDTGGGPNSVPSPFDINTSAWVEGSTDVTIVAVDAVGNTATRTLHFTVDATPPAITPINFANNSVKKNGDSLDLLITDTYLNTATWDNGGGASSFITQWNISTSPWSDGNYDLVVRATDLAGNVVVRSYRIVIDSVAPTITLNTLINGSHVIPGVTVINFTITDPTLGTVTWEEGSSGAQSFTTLWNVSTVGWVDGLHTLTVIARDLAGNQLYRLYRFTADSVTPVVSLSPPATNNSYIVAGAVINFTISDTNLATNVTWNDGTGPQAFASQWNVSTSGFADGVYNIVVIAWDLAGNRVYRSYRFTVDSTLPTVTLNSPAANAHIRAGTPINLTVSDTNLNTNAVVWNNGGANQSLAAPWLIATDFPAPWGDGLYTISVYASDLSGNLRSLVFQITIDSTEPTITLVSPANHSYIPAGTVINFTVVEANIATAQWSRGAGSFAFAVQWNISTATWLDGDYNVTVTLLDRAGNSAYALVHFIVDSTPPDILDPSWNETVVNRGTPLNISVLDVNLLWFSWNNAQGQFANGSAASLAIPTGWNDGTYNVTLTAQDRAGHRMTRVAHITIDSVLPVISGVTPADGSFVRPGTPIQFNVTDTNLFTVQWRRDTGAVLPANGSAPYNVSTSAWADGSYTVQLIATDRAGHQTVFTFQLVTDNTAPVVPAMANRDINEDTLETLDASAATDANPLDTSGFVWNITDTVGALLVGSTVQYQWNNPGNFSVLLTVTDRAGNSASRTFTVRVRDVTPPTAAAGADIAVDEGNQTTLDGGSSVDAGGISGFLWTQTSGPSVGFSPASAVTTFTPTVPGVYVFQLRVTDLAGLSSTDDVMVTVRDITPPTIVLPPYPVVNEGANVVFNASASTDNDPRSAGNMTFDWTFTYGEPQFLFGPVVNWTFATPGSYTIQLTVGDPGGNDQVTTFTLRVNDVPSLASLPPSSITIPGTYQGVVQIVDSDAGDTHNISVRTPATMVVVQLTGNWALEWQPEDIGFYMVNFTLNDGWSSVNISYNLTVGRAASGNQPPVFVSTPNMEASAGSQYIYTPQVNDTDGDSLLFGLDEGPTGMAIASSTGRLTWSHGYQQSSGYRLDDVSLWVWDGAVYVYQNFTIRFIPSGNDPPEFLDGIPSEASVEVTRAVDIPLFNFISDSDDPAGNLTLIAVSGTPGVATATIVGAGSGIALRIEGVSNGTSFVTLTLRDPSGDQVTKTIQVTVRPVGSTAPGGGGFDSLMPLILIGAAAAGGGLLFIMMRRRKGDERAEVAQAVQAQAVEVAAVAPVAVRAPAEAVTVAAAGAAVAGMVPAAAPDKAITYTIEGLFVIYKDGRLLYSKTDMGLQKFEDPELVSSMFTAVQSFIKDSFAAEGELNKMGYGDNQIIIERGKHIFMAAIVYGEPDQEFTDKVRDTIEGIELSYAGVVEEWDGMMDAFADMDSKVAPIVALTAGISRREVQFATTKQEVRMLSELEFFQGFVRLKVGIKNNTPMVITKVTVDIEYNEDVLRLGRVEPAAYRTAGAKVLLGVLNPGEKSSVAYYFDPQICTESQIDGVCRYRDAQGVLHTVSMKTRKAEVVCPLFFTKEHANTAMLKRLVEAELTEKDSKVFEIQKVPPYIKYKDIFDLVKTVVNAHDVQMVREFTRFNPFQGEAWFFGETKVKGYKIVIRASVLEEGSTIEFFAASTNMKAITGLLAEFNHTLNSTIIEKYSDLKIALVFDNEVKAELDRKSLMSQMSSEELEGGETEQKDGDGGPPDPGGDPPENPPQ